MKNIVFVLLIMMSLQLFSQRDVINENVSKISTERPSFSPNGKKYHYFYMGMNSAIATEPNDNSPVISGKSLGFNFGFLEKYRLNNFLAVGYSLEYNHNSYIFKQDSAKNFPDTLSHDRQSIRLSSIGLGAFVRINFDLRRGDYIGHFLDLGAYADWVPFRVGFQKDKVDFDEIVNSRIRRLNCVEKYQYGLYANIGLNKFNIFARYRMSDILKAPYKSAELPRLTVGVGFSPIF